jgi:hypothetical protein
MIIVHLALCNIFPRKLSTIRLISADVSSRSHLDTRAEPHIVHLGNCGRLGTRESCPQASQSQTAIIMAATQDQEA